MDARVELYHFVGLSGIGLEEFLVFVVQIFQLMFKALDVPFLAFAEGSL